MTNIDFLAGLPAVLGIGGYVAYHIARAKGQGSPILATIVSIIKQRGEGLPELDKRLTAKQVFELLQKNPELRQRLESRDYKLLESVMRRDERAHLAAISGMVAALLVSIGAYSYLQEQKPKIVSATVSAVAPGAAASAPPNTIDDLVVNWSHVGDSHPYKLVVADASTPSLRVEHEVMAADHSLRLAATELRSLWSQPSLRQHFSIRIEFLDDDGTKTFGPFNVQAALELMYFVEGRRLTVASMNGQGTLVAHSFEARCVVWPRAVKDGKAEPKSLVLTTEVGKAVGTFPPNFEADASTLKCVYIGAYPSELVRYTNLNTR